MGSCDLSPGGLSLCWCHVTHRYLLRTKTSGPSISAPAWVYLTSRKWSWGLWTQPPARFVAAPSPLRPLNRLTATLPHLLGHTLLPTPLSTSAPSTPGLCFSFCRTSRNANRRGWVSAARVHRLAVPISACFSRRTAQESGPASRGLPARPSGPSMSMHRDGQLWTGSYSFLAPFLHLKMW